MARNTGRGSRVGSRDSSNTSTKTNMWTNRDDLTGRFLKAKSVGGTFKSLPKKRKGV